MVARIQKHLAFPPPFFPARAGTVIPSGTPPYTTGQNVSISATAYPGYSFLDWSGCDRPAGDICHVTMDSNKTIAANFSACPNPPVRGSAGWYSGLQEAYNAAGDGSTIRAQAVLLSGNLDFNRDVSVQIFGGYSCDYSTKDQKTVINGSMTIRKGSVVLHNITIR